MSEASGERASSTHRGIGRLVRTTGRFLRDQARVGVHRLPSPLSRRITRARHLKHVHANMELWTDASFLGRGTGDSCTWRSDQPLAEIPSSGLSFETLTSIEIQAVSLWLATSRFDRDADLERRMDNCGDELGRTRSALQTRLRIAEMQLGETRSTKPLTGNRILVDVRALQTKSFGGRGIGRFARSCLEAVRDCAEDSQITLLIDPRLDDLPPESFGNCEQITWVRSHEADRYSLLVETSPMTHDPAPLLAVLLSGAHSVAVVFDFIPLHHRSTYVRFVGDRAEYARNLDALRCFSEYLCISETVRKELTELVGPTTKGRSSVAWPRAISERVRGLAFDESAASPSGPIVVMTGDDARKNTFGGLAGVAAGTVDATERDVVVLGMNSGDDRVHHWSISAAMRPGEAVDSPRLSDSELDSLLLHSPCVVVPSFDEGLSLPVIEALANGAPVAASDIPAHRELLGTGKFLFDPTSPSEICNSFMWVKRHREIGRVQKSRLARHQHRILEDAIAGAVERYASPWSSVDDPMSSVSSATHRLQVAVATPWPPQASGVADYSAATFRALASLCDVTLFTTTDAYVDFDGVDSAIRAWRSVDELLADPEIAEQEFDVVVAVVGNSHFHLPFVELLNCVDCIVIAHDTRMTEFYLALRDRGGLAQVMLRTNDSNAPASITPALDDQVEDLRLLQNAAMWEVARQAHKLILHSPTCAPLIERQTSVAAHLLPFAHYRVNDPQSVGAQEQAGARTRRGLDPSDNSIHLGTFGYVDLRTKQVDVLVEAAGWLTMWGHPVVLHVVGSADDHTRRSLEARSQELGLGGFRITGYQSEQAYRDWLMAVDRGIQLRISPFLGVSGPLADLASYGVGALASEGLCRDVGAPAYIERLPDSISPIGLAEAILHSMNKPVDPQAREQNRLRYLDEHDPNAYARQLHHLLEQSVR